MQSRISREQLYALLMIRARGDSVFSILPKDVIQHMGALQAHPESDIQSLLSYIAYGQLKEVKAMLAENPRLVMQSGDVETPSGLKVLHVAPLECALGAGDPEIVGVIHDAFERITDEQGEMVADALDVRASQYARYRPHIENMRNQAPYDFSGILYAIKQASADDVQAELNLVKDYQSDLRVALNQFREYFTPGQITVGMHCNYQDFSRGLEVYDEEFDELLRTSNNNDDKLTLFSRQILGLIQLMTFPAVERMAMAQGLYALVEENKPLERTFKFKYGAVGCVGMRHAGFASPRWKIYIEQKLQACKAYAMGGCPPQQTTPSRCVIC